MKSFYPLKFTAADLAELPSVDSVYGQMKENLASKFGTSPHAVHFAGDWQEGRSLMAGFIIHCDRCGRVMAQPVCEHCLECIKPVSTIETWKGFEIHSTVRSEGKNVWIDEVAYEKPAD